MMGFFGIFLCQLAITKGTNAENFSSILILSRSKPSLPRLIQRRLNREKKNTWSKEPFYRAYLEFQLKVISFSRSEQFLEVSVVVFECI